MIERDEREMTTRERERVRDSVRDDEREEHLIRSPFIIFYNRSMIFMYILYIIY